MANDKRRRPRQTLNVPAWIDAEDTRPVRCTVIDISETGARLAVSDCTSAPDQFDLVLSHVRRPGRPCNVVWRLHGLIGIEFVAPARAQADDKDGLDGDVSHSRDRGIVPPWPIDTKPASTYDIVTATLLRKISALLTGGLRRLRLPLGM